MIFEKKQKNKKTKNKKKKNKERKAQKKVEWTSPTVASKKNSVTVTLVLNRMIIM